jgi:hypothetical protein
VIYNAVTIPLIGLAAPRMGLTSGPMAVGIVVANQAPAYLFSRFIGRNLLAGPAGRMN